MIEVTAATEIEASPEAVWRLLTDLDGFTAWNPFIREAHGKIEVGETVRVRVRPSQGVPLRFRAKVVERDEGRGLRWRGHVLADWLACGDHTFEIERLGDHRVRFVQREQFTGILPWLGRRLLAREALRGFDAMGRALAERAQVRT